MKWMEMKEYDYDCIKNRENIFFHFFFLFSFGEARWTQYCDDSEGVSVSIYKTICAIHPFNMIYTCDVLVC